MLFGCDHAAAAVAGGGCDCGVCVRVQSFYLMMMRMELSHRTETD